MNSLTEKIYRPTWGSTPRPEIKSLMLYRTELAGFFDQNFTSQQTPDAKTNVSWKVKHLSPKTTQLWGDDHVSETVREFSLDRDPVPIIVYEFLDYRPTWGSNPRPWD